jgi:integrase
VLALLPAHLARMALFKVNRRTREQSHRHRHSTHVFTYKGRPLGRIYNTAWKRARRRAGIPHLRVHDLKHTFGLRLRAANVDSMDRRTYLATRTPTSVACIRHRQSDGCWRLRKK